jgi:hypothetical protein
MRLTSTLPAYLALAEIDDDAAREAAWTEQYEAAYPEIFTTYHRSWGRHARCLTASRDVPRLARTMPAIEERARRLSEEAERFFLAEGLIDDDLDVVLLVGGHTSNGWVTELDGRSTLFLALELLGEPPYDAVLLTHEAFHVAHAQHGAEEWPEDCAGSLFQEGLAVAVSREVHPGLSDSSYLWFDGEHDEWVDACAAVCTAITDRARSELDTSYDEPRARALFTVLDEEEELPPRAGYWLGDRVARRLRESHSLRDLLAWDHATVRAALADQLSPPG